MIISMTSLVGKFNQLVQAQQPSVEPTIRMMGSLQEQLLSVSRHSGIEASNSVTELSVGPPPLYRKDQASNVIVMPKRQGARVIFWSQVNSSSHAA